MLAQENIEETLTAAARVYWLLTDNQGSIRDITDNAGAQVAHYMFDAFGRIHSGDPTFTRYLYTGREFDATSGLQYNRTRWYDSSTGRFISEDPIQDGSNWYAYVGNSAPNGTDPYGLAGIVVVPPPGHGPIVRWLPPWLAQFFEPDPSDFASMLTPAGVVAGIGKKAAKAAVKKVAQEVGEEAVETTAKKGIYEFPDATAGGAPYVGQSGNVTQRLQRHKSAGRLVEGTAAEIVEVSGDKAAREIAEHQRIQKITGGVPAARSTKVSNQRNPIGPLRRHLLDEK